MVTSRLAGERVHALLRGWLRRMVLASYGLRALAGPRRSVRYVVMQGDTLRQIAREELGDAGRWTEIAEANGLDDLDLEPGQVLVIPVEDA
jgi:nucleoid-associated protein YgaU